MKKQIALSIFVFVLVCLPTLICTGEQAWADDHKRIAQSNAHSARVFIARQSSEFKDALLENITSRLDAQSVSYKVADVSALKKIDEGNYEAVVIIQYVKAGRINGNVRRYLDKTENMGKIVLVTTSGSGNPRTDAWDIDTISAASEMNDLDKITRTVLAQLEDILHIHFSS